MVGIWGMGGLGKTTAAKAIYNQIHHKFEFKSFLTDVSDTTSIVHLQKKLSFDIMDQEIKISTVDEGICWIEEQFSHRRVLVIMDNIDGVEQLNAIIGNHKWFGPGSRIIITTRDKHLLLNVDKVYPAQILNKGEALELFSWHAFGNRRPNKGHFQLSEKVVSYCGGLPLALEVLGSFLCERPPKVWNSQLEKLERTPDGKIIKPLRMSFDGLDDMEKATFLNISCFFIGEDEDRVAKLLDVCGFSATVGINILRERCLVTVEGNKLNMHDLLREMARVIISEKSLGDPGKWSMLWNREDVTNVLTYKSGTEEVEGLALHLPYGYDSFSTEAFANMKKLRLLHLKNVRLNGEYKHLPKELIWLRWEDCPLESIPDDFFNQPRLVVLEMQWSKLVQVWEGSKLLHNLKTLDLSHSWSLQKSPDFSQVPNLEELILKECSSLSEIHPSIGHLKRLSLVNLTGCYNLISLPRDFYESKSVETLLLNWCTSFREVHEDLGEMISLRILEAKRTAIRQVSPSMVGLKNLTRLNLSWCNLTDDAIPKDIGSRISLQVLDLSENNFHSLPSLSGLSKLETLRLDKCFNLHKIPDLPTNLKFLYAYDCPALETMPSFSDMSNLRELVLICSPKLIEVPGLDKSLNSMTQIDMRMCANLTADFRKNILQGWTSCGFGGIFLHGNYVPDWFEFVDDGNKVSLVIPPNDGRKFEGLTLFCLYSSGKIIDRPLPLPLAITVINNTQRTELQANISREDWVKQLKDEQNYLWQGQLSNNKLKLQGGDKVEVAIIFAESKYSRSLKKTGVKLVWDKPMKENMQDLDRASYVFDPHPARFYGEAQSSW